ncbi:MAG: polysaccharide export protein, partial [Alphaproteobacteria bacterium]|nr:polysaccharide export protein [Alphaproteobacteria bacterium]
MTASLAAVNPLLAQEYDETSDSGPSAAIYSDDMSLEALQKSLPAHLQTPLPVKGDDSAEMAAPQAEADSTPASNIEAFYREATGADTLSQFGYAFFGTIKNTEAPAAGTVQDSYVLGAGDSVTIAFLGERKDKHSYTIDQTGTLNIDLLPPVAAAGKTLGELRRDVRAMLDMQAYHGDVYVSLDAVRQLGVLVAGQVQTPGRQAVTPLQTVLEAIENAGGVLKTGTLRQIRLVREGKTIPIDLYGVIASKGDAAILPTLRDGDRIIVPTLGPTIAVTGDVRQPAIYELPAEGALPVHEAISLAGGYLSDGQNRLTILDPQANGQRTASMASATSGSMIGDGVILTVTRTTDRMAGTFKLTGETRSEGTFPLTQYPKLSGILRRAEAFGDDVYPLMGVIARRNTKTLAREMIAFSPQEIYQGRADMPLQDSDTVMLFSRADIHTALHDKNTN